MPLETPTGQSGVETTKCVAKTGFHTGAINHNALIMCLIFGHGGGENGGGGEIAPVETAKSKPSLGLIESPAPRKRPKNPPKEQVAAVAVEIIRDRGEPVMRDDLYDALAERGMRVEERTHKWFCLQCSGDSLK